VVFAATGGKTANDHTINPIFNIIPDKASFQQQALLVHFANYEGIKGILIA
jgi:hypothetical protein